jgi:Gluconate 2-dehydrogenase subunit 3
VQSAIICYHCAEINKIMNRRKAILSFFLIGGGATAAYSGYKWWKIHRTPDLLFLQNNKELIGDLAEVVIPRTDTPGAKEAGVAQFIVATISDCSDRKTQNNFIDGLKQLAAYSIATYNKSFGGLSAAEQIKTVAHFRDKSKLLAGIVGKVQNKLLGKPFYLILRELTTTGYCTSKLGAMQGLAYQYIPGTYQGCLPFVKGQKAWATK